MNPTVAQSRVRSVLRIFNTLTDSRNLKLRSFPPTIIKKKKIKKQIKTPRILKRAKCLLEGIKD